MNTETTMDPQIPLPLGAVNPDTVTQPGGDATPGTVPLPLNVSGPESTTSQPGGDATAGTMPLPVDKSSAVDPEESLPKPAPKRAKSREATGRSRSKGS